MKKGWLAIPAIVLVLVMIINPRLYKMSNSLECITRKSHTCLNNSCTIVNIVDTTSCRDNTGHGTNAELEITPDSFVEFDYIEETTCGEISQTFCSVQGNTIVGCTAQVTKTTYYDTNGNITSVASSYSPIKEVFYPNGEKCTPE